MVLVSDSELGNILQNKQSYNSTDQEHSGQAWDVRKVWWEKKTIKTFSLDKSKALEN